MAGTQGDDLLLRLLERSLCIIPHADIFFYYIVFVCGNMHPTVLTEAKAPGNTPDVFQIVFLDFIFLRNSHGCWSKNNAFHP